MEQTELPVTLGMVKDELARAQLLMETSVELDTILAMKFQQLIKIVNAVTKDKYARQDDVASIQDDEVRRLFARAKEVSAGIEIGIGTSTSAQIRLEGGSVSQDVKNRETTKQDDGRAGRSIRDVEQAHARTAHGGGAGSRQSVASKDMLAESRSKRLVLLNDDVNSALSSLERSNLSKDVKEEVGAIIAQLQQSGGIVDGLLVRIQRQEGCNPPQHDIGRKEAEHQFVRDSSSVVSSSHSRKHPSEHLSEPANQPSTAIYAGLDARTKSAGNGGRTHEDSGLDLEKELRKLASLMQHLQDCLQRAAVVAASQPDRSSDPATRPLAQLVTALDETLQELQATETEVGRRTGEEEDSKVEGEGDACDARESAGAGSSEKKAVLG
eukprot:144295-Rhodomonas_salina.1